MNPEAIAAFTVPTLLFGIPLAWVIFNGLQKVARLRVEEAKARAGAALPSSTDQELRGEVEQLRRELAEVQERLDFAERVLASGAGRTGNKLSGAE